MRTLDLLSSYLPNPLAAQLLRRPERSPIGAGERFQAAVIFADVSGFTPLTEALGRIGPVGAEELTRALNGYFAPLIELVHQWGGIVGKFAGDAMTLIFPGEQAIPHALACALAMQQQAGRSASVSTRAGEFTLRMKLGLAAGEVLEAVVGDERRTEYIFAGTPLDDSADAEHHASPDEIVLHPDLLARLPTRDWLTLDVLDEGYARLRALQTTIAPDPVPPLPAPSDEEQAIRAMRPFLPAPVYELLTADQDSFVNQHRRVTTIFVRFVGLDYAAPQVVERLNRYAARLMETVSRYGGYMARLDMGDKGSKAIILFGAPVAHENDEERALLCALALQSIPAEMGFITAQHIGVNSGHVFAGNVGSERRREYTVMGDAVNLAARLMQAAEPGQILVGQSTHQAAADSFAWRPLPPLQVKGKSIPVTVFSLRGEARGRPLRLQEPHYTLPMVGRRDELALVTGLLTQVVESGRGHTVGLVAEAGMGKSRLAAEVIGRALEMGFVGYGGEGLSHGATTPYLAWRPLLRGLLEVNERQSRAGQIEALQQTLSALDPDLALRLPLLGDALGLDIPDNETTANFEAKLRCQSLFALVADLIRYRASSAPLLLVMEDAHWLDDLSREMLDYVAAQVAGMPILLLTVYRPPEIESQSPLWTTPPEPFTEVRLGPFAPHESRELIHLKLAGRDLPPALATQVEQMAQGNPFFVDEFVNLLQAQEIDLADSRSLEDLQVPDSLHSLIVSRLDQLAESERMTIRIASVIGRLFRARWLLAIYPGEMRADLVERDLNRLSSLELTPLDRPEPELEYLFKHAVTQEVAYSTLSFATRRMLHKRVAGYIEQAYSDNLSAWYAILAYHYRQAEEAGRELEYVRLCAAQAAAQSAYGQAADFYDRAIELIVTHGLSTPEETFDLRRGRAQICLIRGEYDRLSREAAALAELAPGLDPTRQVRALIVQGNSERNGSDVDAAGRYYDRAIELARRSGEQAVLVEALRLRGSVHFGFGEYEQGKRVLTQVIEQADEETWRAGASARQVLGWIVYDEANYEETGRLWTRALATYRAHNDKAGEALLLSNLGALYSTIGNDDEGIAYVEQSLALARQIGYKSGEEEAERLLGDLLAQAGRFEQGREHFERAIALAQQLRSSYTMGYSRVRLAEMMLETGAPLTEVESLCRQALDLLLPGRGAESLGYPWHTLGVVLMRQERWEEARAALEESLRLRREIEQTATITYTLADLGAFHLAQGDLESARACAEEMWGYLFPAEGEGIESPAACLACYRILRAAGDEERARTALRLGYEGIQARASRFASDEQRRAFLERFQVHREIAAAWEQEGF